MTYYFEVTVHQVLIELSLSLTIFQTVRLRGGRAQIVLRLQYTKFWWSFIHFKDCSDMTLFPATCNSPYSLY